MCEMDEERLAFAGELGKMAAKAQQTRATVEAEIVAWLRETAPCFGVGDDWCDAYLQAADAIEAGEHRGKR